MKMTKTDIISIAQVLAEYLPDKLSDSLAEKVAEKVIRRIQASQYPEMIDPNEAAKILGISRQYLLQNKDKYPFKKFGDKAQSRIMFYRDGVMKAASGQ